MCDQWCRNNKFMDGKFNRFVQIPMLIITVEYFNTSHTIVHAEHCNIISSPVSTLPSSFNKSDLNQGLYWAFKRIHLQALMANFLSGNERILRRVFAVFRDFSWVERAFLMALVFLGRRSRGLYFFPRRDSMRIWSATVRSIRTLDIRPVYLPDQTKWGNTAYPCRTFSSSPSASGA